MRRAFAVLAIILLAMPVCGCCAGCPIFDPSTRRTLYADDYDNPANNSTIFGDWSTMNSSPVDPGLIFDAGYGSPTAGEWYIFKEGGSFKYVNISREGGAWYGIYRDGIVDVDGDRLILSDVSESCYPGQGSRMSSYRREPVPDKTPTFELLDNDTMVVGDTAGNITFYRLQQ